MTLLKFKSGRLTRFHQMGIFTTLVCERTTLTLDLSAQSAGLPPRKGETSVKSARTLHSSAPYAAAASTGLSYHVLTAVTEAASITTQNGSPLRASAPQGVAASA